MANKMFLIARSESSFGKLIRNERMRKSLIFERMSVWENLWFSNEWAFIIYWEKNFYFLDSYSLFTKIFT